MSLPVALLRGRGKLQVIVEDAPGDRHTASLRLVCDGRALARGDWPLGRWQTGSCYEPGAPAAFVQAAEDHSQGLAGCLRTGRTRGQGARLESVQVRLGAWRLEAPALHRGRCLPGQLGCPRGTTCTSPCWTTRTLAQPHMGAPCALVGWLEGAATWFLLGVLARVIGEQGPSLAWCLDVGLGTRSQTGWRRIRAHLRTLGWCLGVANATHLGDSPGSFQGGTSGPVLSRLDTEAWIPGRALVCRGRRGRRGWGPHMLGILLASRREGARRRSPERSSRRGQLCRVRRPAGRLSRDVRRQHGHPLGGVHGHRPVRMLWEDTTHRQRPSVLPAHQGHMHDKHSKETDRNANNRERRERIVLTEDKGLQLSVDWEETLGSSPLML